MELTFNKKIFKVILVNAKIESIQPNPEQPRKTFSKSAQKILKKSILQNNGIIEPILVESIGDGSSNAMIIDGERRFRIYKDLGYETIPCYVLLTKLSVEDRLMIWHSVHSTKLRKAWTALEKKQLIIDSSKNIGIEKTSGIFDIGDQSIKNIFEIVELSRLIKRKQPITFAEKILSLPAEILEEHKELIIHKVNAGKIHDTHQIFLIKRIFDNSKARLIFLQLESDISDSLIYIYLSDFRERIITTKPSKISAEYDKIIQLELLINKMLGDFGA